VVGEHRVFLGDVDRAIDHAANSPLPSPPAARNWDKSSSRLEHPAPHVLPNSVDGMPEFIA